MSPTLRQPLFTLGLTAFGALCFIAGRLGDLTMRSPVAMLTVLGMVGLWLGLLTLSGPASLRELDRSDLPGTEVRRFLRSWLRLLMSITFCGGIMMGLLLSVFGISAVWTAPTVVGVTALFWVGLRRPAG